MKKDWTDKIKDKMADYEEAVPTGLLDSVLSEIEVRENKQKQKKHGFVLWSSITGAAAAIIAAVILFNTGGESLINAELASNGSNPTVEQTAAIASPKKSEDKPLPEIMEKTERKSIVQKKTVLAHLSTKTVPEKSETEYSEKKTEQTDTPLTEEPHEKTAEKKEGRKKERFTQNSSFQGSNSHYQSPKRKSRTLQLGLFAANTSTNNGKGEEQAPIMLSNAPLTTLPKFSDHPYSGNEENGILKNEKDIKTSTRHKMPIRAGLSVAYQWNRRWSVASGITYSYLESEISKESSEYTQHSTQKLHYIGIPIEVQYRLMPEKRLHLYLTAGGRIEKCVSGKSYDETKHKGEKELSATHSITEKPLQFSTKAAVGLEYRISKHVGIYAEPGISYYFDNGSSVENIYKDRPLNFQIVGGLRFSISK